MARCVISTNRALVFPLPPSPLSDCFVLSAGGGVLLIIESQPSDCDIRTCGQVNDKPK